ncbi:hypothetical protein [Rickettsia endosymbiont of Aspidapion aeneum]|uniref:hypothetical protein n=1 Tax=Rickettsia endosymbiont of Aspidapion aeneum TaxID=3066247 RepID=UPI00313CF086
MIKTLSLRAKRSNPANFIRLLRRHFVPPRNDEVFYNDLEIKNKVYENNRANSALDASLFICSISYHGNNVYRRAA